MPELRGGLSEVARAYARHNIKPDRLLTSRRLNQRR
jgi:hypothetical protein